MGYAGLSYGNKQPHWDEIECQPGHKYIFSEDKKDWPSAKVECELYGGWLLDIGSMEEQHCLVKFARAQGIHAAPWWWHDGNDVEEEGIYCHADGRYITWFPPKIMRSNGIFAFYGPSRNGLMMNTDISGFAGGWHEYDMAHEYNYICESLI